MIPTAGFLSPPKSMETQTSMIEVYVKTDDGFKELNLSQEMGKKGTVENQTFAKNENETEKDDTNEKIKEKYKETDKKEEKIKENDVTIEKRKEKEDEIMKENDIASDKREEKDITSEKGEDAKPEMDGHSKSGVLVSQV
jgi:hypothetical protein